MDQSIATGSLLLGLVIGFVAGAAWARFRRSWLDVKKGQTQVAGLKKIAWAMTRMATTRIGMVGLFIIAAVAWAFMDSP